MFWVSFVYAKAHFDQPHRGNSNANPGEVEAEWKEPVGDKVVLEHVQEAKCDVCALGKGVAQRTGLGCVEHRAVGSVPCREQ